MLTAVAAALSGGPQPELPGFLNSLAGPLGHYGLWAIALLVLVEDFGIPVPGETVLIAGAIYAGSGRLNVVAVGLVGFAAAVVGDNIGYAIGRFGGRALVERWGKYVFITPERLDKAEAFFDHHGGKVITIARFVEGLRQANGLIAGITEMHWLRFVAFNALGAALWVGTWVSVGYFAGQHISTIYTDITNYSLYAAIAAVVLIAAWVFLRLRRRRREKAALEGTRAESAEAGEASDAGQAGATAQDDAAGEAPRPAGRTQEAVRGTAPASTHSSGPAPGPAHAHGARPPDAQARDVPPDEAERPDERPDERAGDSAASGAGQDAAAGQGDPAGSLDAQAEVPGQDSDRS